MLYRIVFCTSIQATYPNSKKITEYSEWLDWRVQLKLNPAPHVYHFWVQILSVTGRAVPKSEERKMKFDKSVKDKQQSGTCNFLYSGGSDNIQPFNFNS